jgi:hypothetical protein
MGFCSLQHTKVRRSTGRGLYLPATFRLQGLATLLTACSLRARAGFVSHRRRSWDSPFGASPPVGYPKRFRDRCTHLPFSPVVVPNAEATGRPDRPRFLGVNPVGRSCRPGMGLACRPQDAPLGFALLRFSREDLDQDFARSPLACFAGPATNRRSVAP